MTDHKILILAPHPDDETLGCGGTIAKYTNAGDQVTLCIVTTAYAPDWPDEYLKVRDQQIDNAVKILGIENVIELGYPTVKLDTLPQKDITERLSEVIRTVSPDTVYVPFKGDLHRDHRIVFESALVALRPVQSTVQRILAYETLSETEWGQELAPFLPTVYINISDSIEPKIQALQAYKTELREFPHPRSIEGVNSLAKKRGSEINVEYAEAFVLIREIC